MAESRVKDGNYINIQSWMVKDLNLKGNQLLIYAIIYGFTQAENQVYTGSLQYLADWTNSTKQGVLKSLKELIEKNLIGKNEKFVNGIKFCEYYSTEFNNGIKQSLTPFKQNSIDGIQQSLNNNIDSNNKINNIEDIKEIVEYLNNRTGSKFRTNNKDTQKHIKARLKDGFTIDDLKTVIDKKCVEWMNTDMQQYLRPQTLFGTKFESYLNQKIVKNKNTKDRLIPDWFDKEKEQKELSEYELEERYRKAYILQKKFGQSDQMEETKKKYYDLTQNDIESEIIKVYKNEYDFCIMSKQNEKAEEVKNKFREFTGNDIEDYA